MSWMGPVDVVDQPERKDEAPGVEATAPETYGVDTATDEELVRTAELQRWDHLRERLLAGEEIIPKLLVVREGWPKGTSIGTVVETLLPTGATFEKRLVQKDEQEALGILNPNGGRVPVAYKLVKREEGTMGSVIDNTGENRATRKGRRSTADSGKHKIVEALVAGQKLTVPKAIKLSGLKTVHTHMLVQPLASLGYRLVKDGRPGNRVTFWAERFDAKPEEPKAKPGPGRPKAKMPTPPMPEFGATLTVAGMIQRNGHIELHLENGVGRFVVDLVGYERAATTSTE